LGLLFAWTGPAAALPSFAQQTGEPCAACHVGAYGPQLKPYGRDFKLFGYWAADGQNTLPPVALVATASFTHTRADRPPLAGHSGNDNAVIQNAVIAYAGRVAGGVGSFAEVFYDAVRDRFVVSRIDLRRAFTADLAGHDVVYGFDVNNSPGLQDLWNSTPIFEFATQTSAFGASPSVSALVDGRLGSRVAGAGAFAMWDEALYTEFALYTPLSADLLRREGVSVAVNADRYDGAIPYGRIALQHEFNETHYVEVGAYGLSARRLPGGLESAGRDRIEDLGLDATYQYVGDKHRNLAAHATWIREHAQLNASRALAGTRASDHLTEVRADLIYSISDTWTPAAMVFRTTGSTDPNFFRTPGGDPATEGYVLELAYSPGGKKGAPASRWANVRLNARWVGYTEFNGRRDGASDNDTFYLGANVAVAPFGALVTR